MLLDFVLYLVALTVALPLVVFAVECLASLPPSRRRLMDAKGGRPRCGVLIPAHDEEQGIGRTIALVRAQLGPEDRLLVVADNCLDGTAAVARSMGAEVLVRVSDDRRGKGYALAAGIEHLLSVDPPEVVLVLDADSVPGPGLLEELGREAARTGRPVQSRYLFELPPNPSARDRISALAILFKNRIRLLGLGRLSGASHITGTGFAVPTALARPEFFASGHLTEDMELGLRLAGLGYPPIYRDDVQVTGVLPSGVRAATSQRTRWEHGHLSLLVKRGPNLLFRGLATLRWAPIALALDLLVPPLSLLFLMAGAAVVGAVLVLIFDSYRAPLTIILGATTLAVVSFLLAWARYGRGVVSLGELVRIPLYVLWKIPLYFRFLIKPQTKWVRTERDPVAKRG